MYKLKFSTMKKSIIIFCLLMMVGFAGISYAQDAVKETPALTVQQQEAVDEMISMDPKLSAEEIEQLKIAILGAPAKAEPLSDPKLDEQPSVKLTSVNADLRQPVLAPIPTTTTASSVSSGIQADGGKAENVINLHSLSIPGATQLEAPKAEKVVTKPSSPQGVNPQAGPNGN